MNRRLIVLIGSLVLLACDEKGDDHATKGYGEHEGPEGEDEHGEEAHEDAVTLTPEAMAAAQIELASAVSKPLETGIRVSARLSLAQQKSAHVTPRVPGRVDEIRVKLGDKVKKGSVLAIFESPELGRARADYQSAVTRSRVARATHEREHELVKKGISAERVLREAEAALAAANAEVDAADARLHSFGLSEAEIKAMKTDEHYTSSFPLRSPIDGKVLAIEATVGQSVEGTAHLVTVGDPSELWAMLDIFENQLALVRVGQEVVLTVTALPDERFSGRVEYIGDIVEETTRTIHVRVVVPNPEARLKPGMFASAEIAATSSAAASGQRKASVVVPREAVQRIGDKEMVFVPEGENRFEAVPVFTGESSIKEVEIVRGLEPGTKVVVHGAFVLKSELSKGSMGGGHSH